MYRIIQQALLGRIQAILIAKYDVTLSQLAVEQPPNIAMGELALPVAFELAKRLKEGSAGDCDGAGGGVERGAGGGAARSCGILPALRSRVRGYLNIKLNRAATVREIAKDRHADIGGPGFRLIEHTSINPNKAAHIGHLRNAILGDSFQRLLRRDSFKSGYGGWGSELHRQHGCAGGGCGGGAGASGGTRSCECACALLMELLRDGRAYRLLLLGSLCAGVAVVWDSTRLPRELARRKKIRLDTLHALEAGGNETAEIADLISTAVLRRHLETMERLRIEYDFLPRESEILSAALLGCGADIDDRARCFV